MGDAQYVLSAYGIVLATVGGYALWLARRGRKAAEQVPPERRRWSDS